jgi:hypothetical protein
MAGACQVALTCAGPGCGYSLETQEGHHAFGVPSAPDDTVENRGGSRLKEPPLFGPLSGLVLDPQPGHFHCFDVV